MSSTTSTCSSDSTPLPPPPPSDPSTLFSCTNDELRFYIAHYPHLIPINTCFPYTESPGFTLIPKWTLLQHAIYKHDIERILILMTHPIPIDPDMRAEAHYSTPLLMACNKKLRFGISDQEREEQEQREVLIDIEMITLLSHLGADPNQIAQGFGCIFHAMKRPPVLAHLLDVYHPVATATRAAAAYHNNTRSVPSIPISLLQPVDFNNHNIFDWFTTAGNTAHRVITAQELTEMIIRINHKHRQAQITSMYTFIMATYPRIGGSSVVYRIFRSSSMYDPHLLHHIWQFLYIRDSIPMYA